MTRKKNKDWEIVKRWKSESPDFFKKLQWLGGTLVAISPILLVTPLAPISILVGAIGGATTIVAKFPMKGVSLEEAQKLIEEKNKAIEELNKLKTILN